MGRCDDKPRDPQGQWQTSAAGQRPARGCPPGPLEGTSPAGTLVLSLNTLWTSASRAVKGKVLWLQTIRPLATGYSRPGS